MLAAAQHNEMWLVIGKDRSLSQAQQLQEMLDTNEHRNFVASMWQHWRDVEAAKLITPRRQPLLRVVDTEQLDEPPIPACDPRYNETVRRELERLWEKQPSNSAAISQHWPHSPEWPTTRTPDPAALPRCDSRQRTSEQHTTEPQ